MHPQSLSCVQLCDPYDCSPPGSSVHKNFQVRIVEWFAIFYSRRSARPRDWTQVSSITGGFFIIWATREAPKGGLGFTLNQGFYIHAWVSFHLSFKPKASFINWERSFHRVWRKPEGLCDALSSCCLSAGAQFSSVQFSPSVMSNSLWAQGLQQAKLPCPSPTPRAYSSWWLSSWWCHPTISSSVMPFSSCLQSFPVSGSFPTSQFFTSGGQSIGVSASASVLPMNIQDWFPL